MIEKKKWVITIFAMFLISGILSSCSRQKSDQNLISDIEIEQSINEIVVSGELPSVQIAVINQDQIIWSKAIGKGSDTHYVYMNGSIQKVVDATAVLQLVEKGLIDLDADISDYLPFEINHPQYPDVPITTRMLLSHRSGLDAISDQFDWDTECHFVEYRPNCNLETQNISLEEYLMASFTTSGSNFNPNMWIYEPGEKYHYSVSAYPLLRFLIEYVSGEPYPEYMQDHLFAPLEMLHTGFILEDFHAHHAIPHTRIDGENIELPLWNGNGFMMRTTAEDMGKFMLAHINQGFYNQYQLLRPETIELMQTKTTKGKSIFNPKSELQDAGYGLGLIHYQNGWVGHGGSTVGYQSLWQFNPQQGYGYVIFTNVNGILGGQDDVMSVWDNLAEIRDIIRKELDPLVTIRTIPWEWIIAWILIAVLINLIPRWLRRKQKEKNLPPNPSCS